MSTIVTEQTAGAERAARETLASALADAKVSPPQLAGIVERSPSKVVQWLSGQSHTPLYLLAHPRVPELLRTRLRALAPVAPALVVPCETTSALLVGDVGATLHTLGSALSDGKVAPEERRVLAPLVRQLRDRCNQWLARHGGEQ